MIGCILYLHQLVDSTQTLDVDQSLGWVNFRIFDKIFIPNEL